MQAGVYNLDVMVWSLLKLYYDAYLLSLVCYKDMDNET